MRSEVSEDGLSALLSFATSPAVSSAFTGPLSSIIVSSSSPSSDESTRMTSLVVSFGASKSMISPVSCRFNNLWADSCCGLLSESLPWFCFSSIAFCAAEASRISPENHGGNGWAGLSCSASLSKPPACSCSIFFFFLLRIDLPRLSDSNGSGPSNMDISPVACDADAATAEGAWADVICVALLAL